MEKTAIKNFAVWARVKLMEDIRTRLGLLGITEDGISDPLPASTNEVKYFDIGADHPVSIKGKAIHQRELLAEKIRKAGKESNYQSAYRNFIESSAYDWFNRLIAIRYMEVNEYAPLDVRLLSSAEPGKQDPDLVSTPFDGSLEYSESETQQILAWKEQHDNNKLFRFLLFKMCNRLHEVLPGIFEARDDASELLMRQSFIDKDGIIHHLVNDIPEEDWKDQVQIIGWIYQYYNSELKAEVFAKKEKVTKDELPAVTQLFTPDWIVRYMVENSLGRLWIEHLRGLNPDADEKETADKFGWKYYLPEAKQEPDVEQQLAKIREEYATLKPEDLSCLDPCMGSGHILVYMFDVLEQIYTSVGYSEREAAKAILENNIYGLDIDDRAYQLAYFAVMMKARQYNRRILTSGIKAHVYSIQESNGITKNQLQEMGESLSPDEKTKALSQAEKLVDLFHDAKEYGSILNIPKMDWELLRRFAMPKEDLGQTSLNWNQEASDRLIQLIDQGEVMARSYLVTCTNPPYRGMGEVDTKLQSFAKLNYLDSKQDLSTIFMEKCYSFTNKNGFYSMVNIPVWMLLTTYTKLRSRVFRNNCIINLTHIGRGVFGSDFGTVVFTCRRGNTEGYISFYKRLFDRAGDVETETEKIKRFFRKEKEYYSKSSEFCDIPGERLAYWASEKNILGYKNGKPLSYYADVKKGMSTADDNRFLRLWYEVNTHSFNAFTKENAKWFRLCKGGSFRRWYGNNDYVVNWENDGFELKKFKKSVIRNEEYYLKPICLTWTYVTNYKLNVRYTENSIFAATGPCIFPLQLPWQYVLGYLNTKVAQLYANNVGGESITYEVGEVSTIPVIWSMQNNIVLDIVNENIEISREDWNSFEFSWEFKQHPLIQKDNRIITCFTQWAKNALARFDQLKKNEEELNRIFIDIYGLQDELTPEEDDKDVTVRKADLGRDIRSLISYAIGCMFGRYSLDKEGLIYAGGDWKSVQSVYKTYLPDQDNVIPITDQKYLDDDVVERICEFLTVVYGPDTLEENLDFIAKALGNKGLTNREVIRNYMLNDFFKDHCKTYSVTGSGKRPIYWLFDSGKENAFKALVYMHRWDADTTGRVLLYAQQIQQKYETEIRAIDMMLDHITDARQKSTEEKRQEHLKKQLEELVDYEERLEHMANERIAIDLDDGVKVNYEKVQTDRNGKKYQILAPIK
ncbi:BREX-1 system adenine-specific DNA-methyltransferase PglX [Lachnospiraceae bacterium YH-ros2226]